MRIIFLENPDLFSESKLVVAMGSQKNLDRVCD